MIIKKITYIIIIMMLVSACKSTKIMNKDIDSGLSSKRVIKNHYTNAFDKQTFNAKLKVKYSGKTNLPSVTASLRVKKDETIWISLSKLGFPVGKILITPKRVSYYEKINRTYFEGDFALLSNWLGTELDFEKVQNLLLGQAILDLKKEKFDIKIDQKNYLLRPKAANNLYDILFLINPINFKINSQQIKQLDENNTLIITYNNYTTIEDEVFPKEIFIAASDTKNTSTISIDYRNVEFNNAVSFPFVIPKNYERIILK